MRKDCKNDRCADHLENIERENFLTEKMPANSAFANVKPKIMPHLPNFLSTPEQSDAMANAPTDEHILCVSVAATMPRITPIAAPEAISPSRFMTISRTIAHTTDGLMPNTSGSDAIHRTSSAKTHITDIASTSDM